MPLSSKFLHAVFLLTLLFSLIWNIETIGQNRVLRFEKLEVKDAPLFPIIDCIYQDSRGFLWLGTYAGLYRYDGYNLTCFQNIPNDSLSISDNKIYSIVEDKNGNFWVGTQNGLNFFDVKKETFKRFIDEVKYGVGMLQINELHIDKEENLWVGTIDGIFLKKQHQNTFSYFQFSEKDNHSLSSNIILSFFEDSQGNFWISTSKGLNIWNKKTNNIERIPNTLEMNISDLEEDIGGNILIGTDKNIFSLNPENQTYEPHPILSNVIKENAVRHFTKIKNQIWIATKNGLVEYFPKTKEYHHHLPNSINPFSLPNSDVYNTAITDSNLIWTFHFNKPLRFANFEKREFNQFSPFNLTVPLKSVIQYFELYEFEKNKLLIPKKEGASFFNIENGESELFPYQPNYNLEGWKTGIICFHEEKNGMLWVGTSKGIFLFDKSKKVFLPFEKDIKGIESLRENYIRKIQRDQKGNLWVATWYNGICKINFGKKEFKRYKDDLKKINTYTPSVRTFLEDRQGNIWVGTRGGLLKYLPESDDFLAYVHDENDSESISENTAFSIYEDRKGFIWVGTFGGGLNRLDPKTGRFQYYTTEDGLLNNNIFSLIPDHLGYLWLVSYQGVTRFDPEKITFQNFTYKNGLGSKNYDAFMFGESPYSNRIFFGGKSGIDVIQPDKVVISDFQPNVFISDFKLFNESVPIQKTSNNLNKDFSLQQHISFEKEMELNYDQNVITFDYLAIDFSSPDDIQYAYQLEGFDKEWQNVGNKRSVTFTNLSPDTYTFKVKATNADGVWSKKEATLKLTIHPPWWQTCWAYMFYILGGLTAIWMYLKYQRRKYFLEAQLETEQQEAERLKVLDTLKTNLYTNITHEFRTPLTVILGLSGLIQEDYPNLDKEKIISHLQTIDRNGNGLLQLVNQMLDLAKIESGKLDLQVFKIMNDVALLYL